MEFYIPFVKLFVYNTIHSCGHKHSIIKGLHCISYFDKIVDSGSTLFSMHLSNPCNKLNHATKLAQKKK